MKIWLLAKQERYDIYDNKRFLETASRTNVNFELVAPEDFEIIATRGGKKSIFLKGGSVDSLPDCFIPRMGSGTTYFGHAIIRHLEKLGVFVLNTSHSIELAKDKLATIQLLASENIPTPKTMLAKPPLNLDIVDCEFTYPVLLKKIVGSEGKGIVFCKTRTQLNDTIELADPNQHFIIQECMKSSLGRDLRIFVIGGRAIGAILRRAPKGKFKANYSAGGTVENFKLTPEVEWLAVESARLMGLEIAGVDLLFDKEGYSVCEVNSSPYFEGFEKATGIDVPSEVFNFAKVRLYGAS